MERSGRKTVHGLVNATQFGIPLLQNWGSKPFHNPKMVFKKNKKKITLNYLF
jgi:hypothetical protein